MEVWYLYIGFRGGEVGNWLFGERFMVRIRRRRRRGEVGGWRWNRQQINSEKEIGRRIRRWVLICSLVCGGEAIDVGRLVVLVLAHSDSVESIANAD